MDELLVAPSHRPAERKPLAHRGDVIEGANETGHLETIYAKLGIRSRRQLMAMEGARARNSVETRTM